MHNKIRTLVVGAGGREHALVRALKSSPLVEKVFSWPGNAGIHLDAEDINVATGDYAELIKWVLKNPIDLVVIGPENDLVFGLSDMLREVEINVIGPSKEAAQLEGSKIFAKKFMQDFSIPTARCEVVSSVREIECALQKFSPPYVLKADGLAAGKGVFICETQEDLLSAAYDIFENDKLGEAGRRALIEEHVKGDELSVLVLTNGQTYQILPYTRDHKRLLDGNKGPNTGGMGVVGPVRVSADITNKIEEKIVKPTIAGIGKRDYLYRGVIFIGVMVVENEPLVLEYNVRFGDPETQVTLPLLDGDWAEIFSDLGIGYLRQLKWKDEYISCVVAAAKGYPDTPLKGVKINGDLNSFSDTNYLLHAGTIFENDSFKTNGGRILNAIGIGSTLEGALTESYKRLSKVNWDGMQYRRDIGK